jgi:hypothetical protein
MKDYKLNLKSIDPKLAKEIKRLKNEVNTQLKEVGLEPVKKIKALINLKNS